MRTTAAKTRQTVVGALLLLASAARHSSGSGPVEQRGRTAGWVIVPGVSVGPILIGMSRDDLIEVLGSPARSRRSALEYPADSLAVILDRAGERVVAVFGGVASEGARDLALRFEARGWAGVGIGTKSADVLAAFGVPSSHSRDGRFENVTYAQRGISFVAIDGEVAWLAVRKPVHAPLRR